MVGIKSWKWRIQTECVDLEYLSFLRERITRERLNFRFSSRKVITVKHVHTGMP